METFLEIFINTLAIAVSLIIMVIWGLLIVTGTMAFFTLLCKLCIGPALLVGFVTLIVVSAGIAIIQEIDW